MEEKDKHIMTEFTLKIKWKTGEKKEKLPGTNETKRKISLEKDFFKTKNWNW